MKLSTWIAVVMVATSIVAALRDGLFYWYSLNAPQSSVHIEHIFYLICLVLWIEIDSKSHPNIARPFDYGFLLYVFWLPYLPYYLWRTRGALGLLMSLGFLSLPMLGWTVQVGVYLIDLEWRQR
jgi:hypothetical protein